MHTVFIEEELAPDCFPVAKNLFVRENAVPHSEVPCWFAVMDL